MKNSEGRQYLKQLVLKKIAGPMIPYITIGPGLLVFHNAWAAILAYHLGMTAIILLSGEPICWRNFLRSTRRVIPLVTTLAGAAGGLILFVLWPYLAIPSDINSYLGQIGLTQATWPFFLVYFIMANSWIEEYYWRWFLSDESKYPVLNDLFFSGYHIMVLAGKVGLIWLIIVFAVLVLAAWCWRQSNRICGGLLPSTASHLAADITIILVIFGMTMR
jgi:hypothetical protein